MNNKLWSELLKGFELNTEHQGMDICITHDGERFFIKVIDSKKKRVFITTQVSEHLPLNNDIISEAEKSWEDFFNESEAMF